MLTFDQFIAKYKGKGVDVDGFPKTNPYQCVDLIRQYIKEVLNQPQPKGVTGAKDFFTNFETDPNLNQYFNKIVNTPEGVPSRGDIIIWGATYGAYGHIAIVNWANASQFQALSQNDPLGSLTTLKNYSYNHILGWFSPKKDTMSDYEEAIRKAVAYDEVCQLLGQPSTTTAKETTDKLSKIISDKDRYQKERDQARQERDNYAEENKGLNTQVELLNKDITSLINELEKCLSEVPTEESLEKDFEITGRKIIKTTGDTVVETSYRVKE
jgi:hypothetical protein